MMNQKLFCNHNFVFQCNVVLNRQQDYTYKRSVWMCSRCGKFNLGVVNDNH